VKGVTQRGGTIIGWGAALPDKIVTNEDLQARIDTTSDWIIERTGIHERRVGGTTAGLAAEAARRAIECAGVDPASIDQLVLATTTPDRSVPATASTVQHLLGLSCGAYDVNAACSGFTYGLVTAHGLIALGAKRVLVIGAETLSRITDWDDRGTAILFADGAGAVLVDTVDGPGDLLSWHLVSRGDLESILYCDTGGYLTMEGKEVFRQAVRMIVDIANKVLQEAGLSASDVTLMVPHQANIRIIEGACSRLGIPIERSANVLHNTGNTSSASIPLALAKALDDGAVSKGDIVLLVGFGAGMTAAAAVLRWNGKTA
jgi:3-oxoacyl-[acyl-carrier-protein] synthase III